MTDLQATIDAAWEDRAAITTATRGEVRDAVDAALALLDSGEARVAAPDTAGGWTVNQWLKKAVLLSFHLNDNAVMPGAKGRDRLRQGAAEIRRLGRQRLPRRRLSRRPRLDRPSRGVHRQGRGADAQLRQHRCQCR